MKNLNLALKNNAIATTNSFLRSEALASIVEEQTKNTLKNNIADPNAQASLVSVSAQTAPTLTVKTTDLSPVSSPKKSPLESAIESTITQLEKSEKRKLSDAEKENIANVIEQRGRLSGEVSRRKPPVAGSSDEEKPASPASTAKTEASTWTASDTPEFANLDPNIQTAIKYTEDFKKLAEITDKTKIKDFFDNYAKNTQAQKFGSLTGKQTAGNSYPFFVDEKYTVVKNTGMTKAQNRAEQAYDLFLQNPEKYATKFEEYMRSATSGLVGGSLRNPRNFGNLYLSEKALKKNLLTIYKPQTKTVVISKNNISPLLKQMIFDIQQTLEFDKNDYNNLEADEKRIIERIIRFQQDMKDINVKKLIDDDEIKIKKRLSILEAQINAGNNSKLVRDEMLYLVQQLFKNGAISQSKYVYTKKAIEKLA